MIMYRGEAGFENKLKYEVWNLEFAKKRGSRMKNNLFS